MATMSAQNHPFSYNTSQHWGSGHQAPGRGSSSTRSAYPMYNHPYAADQSNYNDEEAYSRDSVVAPDLRVTAPSRTQEERRPDSILSDDKSVYSERMSTTTLSAPQQFYSSLFQSDNTNSSHHLSALSTQSSDLSRDSWQGSTRPDSNVDPFSFMKYESPRQQLPKVVVSSPSENSFKRHSRYGDDADGEIFISQPITPPPFQRHQGRVPSAVGARNFSRPTRYTASTSTSDLSTTQEAPGRPPAIGSEERKREVLERNLHRQRLGQGSSNSQPASPSASPSSPHLPPSSPSYSRNAPGYGGSQNGSIGNDYMPVPGSRSRSPSPSRAAEPGQGPPFPQSSASSSSSGNLSPTTPQVNSGLVPLPSSHPGLRTSSPESIYSVYSYYNLDNASPEPSPPTTANSDQSKLPESSNTPPTTSTSISTNTSNLTQPASTSSSKKGKSNVGDLPTNPKTAEEFLTLGISHHEADRLAQSAECFEKSATVNGGCAVGMLMWGLSLRHGWGVPKDEQRAFKLLKKAAEHAVVDLQQGNNKTGRDVVKKELVLAVYEVGQCFFQGWGVPRDKAMGVSYFQTAAQLGDPDAQQDLAFCLANGKGCKKDRKAAAKWYRAAAEQGASTVGLAWIYKSKFQD